MFHGSVRQVWTTAAHIGTREYQAGIGKMINSSQFLNIVEDLLTFRSHDRSILKRTDHNLSLMLHIDYRFRKFHFLMYLQASYSQIHLARKTQGFRVAQ